MRQYAGAMVLAPLLAAALVLSPKETKVTFTGPGTYTYMCQIHPNMVGTVNVHP